MVSSSERGADAGPDADADVGGATPLEGDEPVAEDLVLVSNREPYRHTIESPDRGGDPCVEDESIAVEEPSGGLTAGLDPVMQRLDGTWIAWGDGDADFAVADADDCVSVPPEDPAYTLRRLRLSDEQVEEYYEGYANRVLWPLCHSFPGQIDVDPEHWETYQNVNEQFANAVLDHVDDDSVVWLQDYHFALAPQYVQEQWSDGYVMHFYHIPWPGPDVLRVSPHHEPLLRGLLGNDLLAFHLPEYGENFLRCADALLEDAVVDWSERRVHHAGHATTVASFPLGVDAADIAEQAAGADGTFWHEFCRTHGIARDTDVAIGVDRLDYTKGIPRRLDMLEHLWESSPERRGDLTYVQKASPTRENIPAYQELRERVESRIAAINDRFGTDDWQPIVYTTELYDQENLVSLYRHADVGLVTPLRDGMNLVAKEYVASQVDDDGALVLSRLAGAAEQLGDDAVTVDPYDAADGADAIEYALEMDADERTERMRELRRVTHDADLASWIEDARQAPETLG